MVSAPRTPGRPSRAGHPRSDSRDAAAGPATICRLRVPLPDSAWIATFSREHPELLIEVLSRLDLGGQRSLTEVRLHGEEPGPWAEEMRRLPRVERVEQLESGPSAVHLRLVHHTSEFVPIFRTLRLLRRFPFSIQAGEATWVVVASPEKVRTLLGRLKDRAPGASLESVRRTEAGAIPGGLTPRQADLLRRALAAGYFEVPRAITLTDLAKNLGMAASSLSEALATVEKKLIERWPATG